MGKYSLPLGFRFHPTDVELVKYYLKRKVLGKKFSFEAIAEIDIYKYAPWDLPDMSSLKSGDLKWFFFCPVGKKYAKGARLNRATVYGYWKVTGKDRPVMCNDKVVGMIKTLVFHEGKAPRGDRTDWVMHEYRLEEKELAERGIVQDSYVLCVIFKKDGMGPRNGAQYGAPFKEEDWSDDEESVAFGSISSSDFPQSLCTEAPIVVSTETNGDLTCMDAPLAVPVVADAVAQHTQVDDIESMLDIFSEDDTFMHDNGQMTGTAHAVEDSADDEMITLLSYFTEDHNWNNVLYPFE